MLRNVKCSKGPNIIILHVIYKLRCHVLLSSPCTVTSLRAMAIKVANRMPLSFFFLNSFDLLLLLDTLTPEMYASWLALSLEVARFTIYEDERELIVTSVSSMWFSKAINKGKPRSKEAVISLRLHIDHMNSNDKTKKH